MFGPDKSELTNDVLYTWETDSELRLDCQATGNPAPKIIFTSVDDFSFVRFIWGL